MLYVDGVFKFSYKEAGTWSTIESTTSPDPLLWYHVAVERDGETVSLYVNGVPEGSATFSGEVNSSSDGLVVGRHVTNVNNYYFSGHMDEIRVAKGTARFGGDFSDNLPNKPYLDMAAFIDGDSNGSYDDGETYADTIQAVIDEADANDEVYVLPGTYEEALSIPVGITLTSTDGAAATTLAGSGATPVTVAADGVTIDGFTLTNPDGTNVIHSAGNSSLTIRNNTITDVGTAATGSIHAIAVVGTATASTIAIEDNEFSNLGTEANDTGGASAIAVGWSNYSNDVSGLLIQNNTITHVRACTDPWVSGGPGGQGAYGILINLGGQTIAPQILNNTISDLEGWWSHAIGLEGDTPDALVQGNIISNLVDYKTGLDPSDPDAAGVMVEDNASADTVTITGNSFSDMSVGVRNNMVATVDAQGNWWGDTEPSDDVYNPGGGSVSYAPFWSQDYVADDHSGAWTWHVDGSGYIQDAVDKAEVLDGDTIYVDAGTYPEQVEVTKAVTLAGMNDPAGVDAAVVEGKVNIRVDGVTVSLLKITNTGGAGEQEGIFVGAPAGYTDYPAKTIEISNNLIDGVDTSATDVAAEGIHVKSYNEEQIDGINIIDNTIKNVSQPAYGANGIKLQADLNNVNVLRNTIENIHGAWSYGVVATPSGSELGFPKNVTIEENIFSGVTAETAEYACAVGLDTAGGGFEEETIPDATELEVHYNEFGDTYCGVVNKDLDEVLDAEYNDWGDPSGPYHDTENPDGTGAAVSDKVDFDPWLGGDNLYIKTDAETDPIEDSTGTHDVTSNGPVTVEAFGKDAAMAFDGSGDYLSVPASADWDFGAGDFTIDLWVNPVSVSGYNGLLSAFEWISGSTHDAYKLYIDDGVFTFDVRDEGTWTVLTGATPASAGAWYHVAAERDGDELTLYVNGLAEDSATFTGSVNSSSDGLVVGRHVTNVNNYYFSGHMDEIRVAKGTARFGGDFSDNLPNKPYLDMAAFIDGDSNGSYDDGETYADTIQAVIDEADANDEVYVLPGTYEEALSIPVGITLTSTDGAAATTLAGSGATPVTVAADGVTIDGFTLTNPDGTNVIHSAGNSSLTIRNNTITDVGTAATGSIHAIAVVGTATASTIAIEDNEFSNLGTEANDTGGASAIAVGWSNYSNDVSGLLIQNNTITHVRACTDPWVSGGPGGQGAYGILINLGGQTIAPQILNNTISDLEGWWSHAIGLEGDTPDALVQGNIISNLVDYKTGLDPSDPDAAGVMVEDNASADTVTITGNSFSDMSVGVRNNMVATVDAQGNWWGDTEPSDDVYNPGGGSVSYAPFWSQDYVADDHSGAWTWHVDGSGYIQDAVDKAEVLDGDTIYVDAGTYPEQVEVTKAVTLAGMNDPAGVDAAVVEGKVNIRVDGVTVSLLKITNTGGAGEQEGIFVGAPAGYTDYPAKTIEISNNLIDGVDTSATDVAAEGIHVKSYNEEQIDGINIIDNTIKNVSQPAYGANGIKLQADLNNVNVLRNTIENIHGAWSYGVVATPSGSELGFPKNVTIEENIFSGVTAETAEYACAVGLDTAGGGFEEETIPDATELEVHYNEFGDTYCGVVNKDLDEVLDAEYNDWGDPSGPYHDTENPDGTGAAVSDKVDFDPWLGGDNLYIKTDAETDPIEDSTGTHDVTSNGPVTVEAFGKDAAMAFDGSGDYLSVPASADWDFGAGDFTIDLWVNPVSVSGYNGLLSAFEWISGSTHDAYKLYIDDGVFTFDVRDEGTWTVLTGATPASAGAWYHVAAERDGDELTLYVNGLAEDSATFTGSVNSSSDGLVVGRHVTNVNNYYFSGHMDEIRVAKGTARFGGDFSDNLPNKPYLDMAAFIDGNSNGSYDDGETYGDTIQTVIDEAAATDEVYVLPGTYEEAFSIPVGITLTSTDGAAATTLAGSGATPVTVAADGVTIDGFTLTNPDGTNVIQSAGNSSLAIRNNTITDVGTVAPAGGSAHDIHAVAIVGNNADASTITIEDNEFSNIGTVENDWGSASAIGVGWTGQSYNVSGLVIQDNTISGVRASTEEWTGSDPQGQGAYGIIINLGAQTIAPQILDNTISDLEGLWAHAIGLEGDTPDALVQGNIISNLVDYKTALGDPDAAAVMVESNASADTVTITENSFTDLSVGVRNQMVATVDARGNWWGDTEPSDDVYNPEGGSVSYVPFWSEDYVDDDHSSPWTWQVDSSGYIQDAIDAASDGDTINVGPGDYAQNVGVTKEVTLQSTDGAGTTLITGTGTAERVSIDADNVTIDGFTITNPTGNNGITTAGFSYLTIKNNILADIGSSATSGNSHGVIITGSAYATDIVIQGNQFIQIHGGESGVCDAAAKSTNGSAKAIGVCCKDSAFNVDNLTIQNNIIADVNACTCDFDNGGKGAYGILLGLGANGNGGEVLNAKVIDNDITDLEGLWATGIGLEGPTPGAEVTGNTIDDLTDHKSGGGTPELDNDAAAVKYEDNADADSVLLEDNSFSNCEVGVRNLTSIVVDATNNWWGADNGPSSVGGGGASGSGVGVWSDVIYDPWIIKVTNFWINSEDKSASDPIVDVLNFHTVTSHGNVQHENPFGENSAIAYDGSGDYLSVPASADWDFGGEDFTIDLWVNPASVSGYNGLLSAFEWISGSTHDAYKLYIDDGVFTFDVRDEGTWTVLTGATPASVGAWYHVAAERDGDELTLYVNGLAEDSETFTGSANSSGAGLVVGRHITNLNNYYFSGHMDEIRVAKGTARFGGDFSTELPNDPK
ncbi:MAG: LamG-like jellyroll fold domain-containing protein [Desulfobacterales bacterium]|nr:LamG-like jellyroll fold domain-containing protein [Desulfobacterales bacterium]